MGYEHKNNITAYTEISILISLKNKEQILIGSKFKIDFFIFKLEELLKLYPNFYIKKMSKLILSTLFFISTFSSYSQI